MEIELKSFTPAEQATFRLRALYEQAGYRKYRASRFEEYALYQEYQRFLPDSQVITFTDLDGKLRAIKPRQEDAEGCREGEVRKRTQAEGIRE